MRKIKKETLKLEKEVIASLTENDLSTVKGGADFSVDCEKDTLVCFTMTKDQTICKCTKANCLVTRVAVDCAGLSKGLQCPGKTVGSRYNLNCCFPDPPVLSEKTICYATVNMCLEPVTGLG